MVQRHVRAGVAVEIGQTEHAAAGQQVGGVLPGVEHLVPEHRRRLRPRDGRSPALEAGSVGIPSTDVSACDRA